MYPALSPATASAKSRALPPWSSVFTAIALPRSAAVHANQHRDHHRDRAANEQRYMIQPPHPASPERLRRSRPPQEIPVASVSAHFCPSPLTAFFVSTCRISTLVWPLPTPLTNVPLSITLTTTYHRPLTR